MIESMRVPVAGSPWYIDIFLEIGSSNVLFDSKQNDLFQFSVSYILCVE